MKKGIVDEVLERVRSQYPQRLASVNAYLAPTGRPTPRATLDRELAKIRPEELAQMAQLDPVLAEQADQRLAVLEARSAASPYPDSED